MRRLRYPYRLFLLRSLVGVLLAYNVGVFNSDQTPLHMVMVLIAAVLWFLTFDF